jgi:hypothetical protein
MNAISNENDRSVHASVQSELEALISRYGALRLWVILGLRLVRRAGGNARRPVRLELSDHLRRDIGLPPQVGNGRHWPPV